MPEGAGEAPHGGAGLGAVGGVEIMGNKADFRGVTDPIWEWLLEVPLKIFSKLEMYIGVLAFYFGVFLPSLPYTIFMVTVVGWVLGVIQTVIAAPLWAIMHMRPSQTFVGSEAQGYLLLMALFVRPALAVIGLFAATLVADPLVDYIAKAFFAATTLSYHLRVAVRFAPAWRERLKRSILSDAMSRRRRFGQSPTTCPSPTSTQPTRGLGVVVNRPSSASWRARAIHRVSSTLVDMIRTWSGGVRGDGARLRG